MSRGLSKDDVRARLVSLINQIVGIPIEKITDRVAIDNELQMPSVVFVELQVAIETEYDIQLDPLQVVELNEFAAILDYVYDQAAGNEL